MSIITISVGGRTVVEVDAASTVTLNEETIEVSEGAEEVESKNLGSVRGLLVQGSGYVIDEAVGCIIQGSGNTVKLAINCTIQGSGNTVREARGCAVQGTYNKVILADSTTHIQGLGNIVGRRD
jgi:hypothetical protein